MTLTPASIPWFARHELRLAWRDALHMMTGGRRTRLVGWIVGSIAVYAVMLLVAWFTVQPWIASGAVVDKQTLVLVTGTGALFWAVTLSQALESVTRVYYGRSDLDLVLSSPASARLLFAVRAGALFLNTAALGCILVSPLVLAILVQDGPRWLAAFLVLAALAAISVAFASIVTRLLFRLIGPKHTRLVAQIIAGIVGAGFVIGIQAAAILSHDGYSRTAFFESPTVQALAPSEASALWLPARGAMGDWPVALLIFTLCLGVLAITIALIAPSYGTLATSAASVSQGRTTRRPSHNAFRAMSPRQVLRRKEWKLLRRDPWLLSQTLMQLLYLLPPALLLWVNYGATASSFIIIVPVLIMASGQLAGGLAWLAISGEDAFDLVATAPLPAAAILRAKVEAVLAVIAIVLAPILLALAVTSLEMALITAVCAVCAASAATAIQLWFRVPSKRAMFRRRQVASRAATLTEAFSSILWAGTGAVWVAAGPFAVLPGLLAVAVLGLARLIAPKAS